MPTHRSTELRSFAFAVAATVALIASPRASQQLGRAPLLAQDGVTVLDRRDAGGEAFLPHLPPGPANTTDLLYFEENGGGGGVRGLYDFAPATGTSTLRSPVGGSERLFALAVQPSTGVVFGVDPARNAVFTVDPNTGVVTLVVALVGVTTVANITFDPLSGQLFGSERNTRLLYTIDLATGNVTTIGTFTQVRSGLTFAPDGTLYGTTLNGALYRINPLNAAETLVGGGGGPGLAEDATARTDGTLFVTDYDGDIFRIDPTTGANTLVGMTGLASGLLGIVPSPSRCRLVAATESVRAGTPPNPLALRAGATTRPIIGCIWDPAIDHTSFLPGAVLDLLVLGAPLNVPSPYGTLLCNPSLILASPAVSAPFSVPIPLACNLAGAALGSQGASSNGRVIALTNAVDVRIGSF